MEAKVQQTGNEEIQDFKTTNLLNSFELYKNKLIFNKFEDFKKFISTSDTKYITPEKGMYSFLHCVCKYINDAEYNKYFDTLVYDIKYDINQRGGKDLMYYPLKILSDSFGSSTLDFYTKLLEQPDINVNNACSNGCTALMSACLSYKENKYGDGAELIEMLLNHPKIDLTKTDSSDGDILELIDDFISELY